MIQISGNLGGADSEDAVRGVSRESHPKSRGSEEALPVERSVRTTNGSRHD
jgi:hypothetical protein